jgi:hypothetical protein
MRSKSRKGARLPLHYVFASLEDTSFFLLEIKQLNPPLAPRPHRPLLPGADQAPPSGFTHLIKHRGIPRLKHQMGCATCQSGHISALHQLLCANRINPSTQHCSYLLSEDCHHFTHRFRTQRLSRLETWFERPKYGLKYSLKVWFESIV